MKPRRFLPALLLAAALGAGAWYLLSSSGAVPPEYQDVPGARLFYQYECGKCHAVNRLPGARGTVGVPLDGVGTRAGSRVEGVTAQEYLRQSLVKPRAYVVKGFLEVMPAYGEQLSDEQLNELVDWLLTLEVDDGT